MNNRLSKHKPLATMIALGLCTFLTVACSSNELTGGVADAEESGSSDANESPKRSGDKSTLSKEELKKLLLTTEVEGYEFNDKLKANDYMSYMADFASGMKLEPAKCQQVLESANHVRDFLAVTDLNLPETTFAVLSLYNDPAIVRTLKSGMQGCKEVTMTMDMAGLTQDLFAKQDIAPEIRREMDKVETTTVTKFKNESFDLPLAERPDQYLAIEQTGTTEKAGTKTALHNVQIMGVVDGLVVFTQANSATGREPSEDDKAEVKHSAIEIFNAQIKKVKDA